MFMQHTVCSAAGRTLYHEGHKTLTSQSYKPNPLRTNHASAQTMYKSYYDTSVSFLWFDAANTGAVARIAAKRTPPGNPPPSAARPASHTKAPPAGPPCPPESTCAAAPSACTAWKPTATPAPPSVLPAPAHPPAPPPTAPPWPLAKVDPASSRQQPASTVHHCNS